MRVADLKSPRDGSWCGAARGTVSAKKTAVGPSVDAASSNVESGARIKRGPTRTAGRPDGARCLPWFRFCRRPPRWRWIVRAPDSASPSQGPVARRLSFPTPLRLPGQSLIDHAGRFRRSGNAPTTALTAVSWQRRGADLAGALPLDTGKTRRVEMWYLLATSEWCEPQSSWTIRFNTAVNVSSVSSRIKPPLLASIKLVPLGSFVVCGRSRAGSNHATRRPPASSTA